MSELPVARCPLSSAHPQHRQQVTGHFILLGLGEWTYIWPTGTGVRMRASPNCCYYTSLGLTTVAPTTDMRCFSPLTTVGQHQVQRDHRQLETARDFFFLMKAPKIPIFIENSSLSGEEGKKIVTGPRSEQTLSRMISP